MRMTEILKSGYLRRLNDNFLGKKWKQHYVALYKDSSLIWFKEQGDKKPQGGIVLKRVCQFIAVGQICSRVPRKPELPKGASLNHLLGIPKSLGNHGPKDMEWFLFVDNQEMVLWMTAISQTLPPPPGRPPGAPQAETGKQMGPSAPAGAPPPYPVTGTAQYPVQHGQYPVQHGQYPVQPAVGGTNTTVVIKEGSHCQGGGGGDLAAGLVVGATLGAALTFPAWYWGYGWGYHGPLFDCYGPSFVCNDTFMNETVVNNYNFGGDTFNYTSVGGEWGGYNIGTGYDVGGAGIAMDYGGGGWVDTSGGVVMGDVGGGFDYGGGYDFGGGGGYDFGGGSDFGGGGGFDFGGGGDF